MIAIILGTVQRALFFTTVSIDIGVKKYRSRRKLSTSKMPYIGMRIYDYFDIYKIWYCAKTQEKILCVNCRYGNGEGFEVYLWERTEEKIFLRIRKKNHIIIS